MGTSEPVELRPGLVRVPRRRFGESMRSIAAAIMLVGAGAVAGAVLQRAEMRAVTSKAEAAAADARASEAREEVREIALDACLARHELRRLTFDADCAAGRVAPTTCARNRAEGQYRMRPCSQYLPDDRVDGGFLFRARVRSSR
jgi:hypothetical protein